MPKNKKSKARPDEPLTPKGSDSRSDDWPFRCAECGGPRSRQAKRCQACERTAGDHRRGLTPEERTTRALCNAVKANGSTCRLYAGQGTDHAGVGRCKHHGGGTPNGKKAAADIEIRRRMIKMGAPLDVRPGEALMSMLRASAGHVSWLHEEITVMEDLSSPEATIVLDRYDDERQMLTKISEACIRAGATEAMVRLEQQRATQLLELIHRASDTARLTPDQRRLLGVALRREVAAMRLAQGTGDEQALSDAEAQLKRVLAESEPEPLTVPAVWVEPEKSP